MLAHSFLAMLAHSILPPVACRLKVTQSINGAVLKAKTSIVQSPWTKSVQKRFMSHKLSYYFNKFYPPTGVPTASENEEPWDFMDRPKRRQGQLARRGEKLITLNDYYTLFKPEAPPSIVKMPPIVPEPRNGMTVELFLKTIGRGCDEYADKFEGSWEKLFSTKSFALKKLGIPVRTRKWILHWTERYRQGDDPWYTRLKSKASRNSYEKLEWRKKLVTQKHLREEWGLD